MKCKLNLWKKGFTICIIGEKIEGKIRVTKGIKVSLPDDIWYSNQRNSIYGKEIKS